MPPEIRTLAAALDAALAGQESAKTGLLLALLAREHAWLLGPPGCGKTRLAEALASASGARVAAVRFHRDVRDADLFGPVRLRRLRRGRRDVLSHRSEGGGLLDAEVAVLDDLTRAPGETVAPLLGLLGSRRHRGRPVPLETAIATGLPAGSAPYDDDLDPTALDRFAVQVRMTGLLLAGDRARAREVLEGAEARGGARLPPDRRRALQARAARLPVGTGPRRLLVSLVSRLIRRAGPEAGARITDRTFLVSALRLLRAHALLRGATEVGRTDLAVLRYMTAGRLPGPARQVLEELLSETVGDEPTRDRVMVPGGAEEPPSGREAAFGLSGRTSVRADAGEEVLERPLRGAGEGAPDVDVGPLLRALEGQLERARADHAEDPGGQPRSWRGLRTLDEAIDSDPLEAVLFAEGSWPGPPRVARRVRRNRGGAIALLRDVSASMEGRLSRWAGEVVAGIVHTGARRRMRLGYVEFNHRAERFSSEGRFFHRRYRELLGLAARRRAEGRTSYEAPLGVALREFRAGARGARHVVLLTDGVPVLGDPDVVRERRTARRLGVRVHTVFLGLGAVPEVLDTLSRDTGGLAFVARPGPDGRMRVRARSPA